MNTDELNDFYKELERIKERVVNSLKQHEKLETGYFNGHYRRNDKNEYVLDYFPIPVISIAGLCDIEINIDKISISTKLSKDNALNFAYEKLLDFNYEVYGVNDFLNDFYLTGYTTDQLISNIVNSSETEIGFSFYFSKETSVDELCDFILTTLKSNSFYY